MPTCFTVWASSRWTRSAQTSQQSWRSASNTIFFCPCTCIYTIHLLVACCCCHTRAWNKKEFSRMNSSQPYREHLVSHQGSNIYVRHYAGTGPAFVLMHGFPDNLHIYDRLLPALRGRQVITFDFLFLGASHKPTAYAYTRKQHEGELHPALSPVQI